MIDYFSFDIVLPNNLGKFYDNNNNNIPDLMIFNNKKRKPSEEWTSPVPQITEWKKNKKQTKNKKTRKEI